MKETIYIKAEGIDGLSHLLNKYSNDGFELINLFLSKAESWNQTHIQMRRASEDFFDIYFRKTDNTKSYIIIPEGDAIELLSGKENKLEYVYQNPNEYTQQNEIIKFPFNDQIWVVLSEGTVFLKI